MANGNAHILKILTGAQTGVEVSLSDGEYVLGSGSEDDLQFVDVTLKAGHARLRLQDGIVEIAGGGGPVQTKTGLNIATGDEEWRQVDDLDVITIGTTAFAVGGTNADWSRVANYRETLNDEKTEKRKPKKTKNTDSTKSIGQYAWAACVAIALIVGMGWVITTNVGTNAANRVVDTRSDFEIVKATFKQFPFASDMKLRQEVDGVIFANGYVERPAERRALRNAIDETGIPVRMRIWVRSSIKTQIEGVIESQSLPIDFALSNDGVATFSGDVLDDTKAARFISAVEDEITGISTINSDIKTAKTYLADVRTLGERSELIDNVIFRLDGELIEASGVIVPQKLDNWVGFVQSYARRFADRIPLRSFVQLVNEKGEVIAEPVPKTPGAPIVISPIDSDVKGTKLNLRRLKEGSFSAEDVFQGLKDNPPATTTPTPPATTTVPLSQPQARTSKPEGTEKTLGPISSEPRPTSARVADSVRSVTTLLSDSALALLGGTNTTPSSDPKKSTPNAKKETDATPKALARLLGIPGTQDSVKKLVDQAKSVLSPDSKDETPSSTDEAKQPDFNLEDAKRIVDELKDRWGLALSLSDDSAQDIPLADAEKIIERRFLPLVIRPNKKNQECWAGSQLTHTNLPVTLFWLDFLSVTDKLDISRLDIQGQHLLLEAALSPQRVLGCAKVVSKKVGFQLDQISLFLSEIQKNPDFVRFIVRNLDTFNLEISGVYAAAQNRYVQTAEGLRLREGASPNTSSKLSSVGELGVLIRQPDRLSTIIYDENLNWKSDG